MAVKSDILKAKFYKTDRNSCLECGTFSIIEVTFSLSIYVVQNVESRRMYTFYGEIYILQ